MDETPLSKRMKELVKRFMRSGIKDFQIWDTSNGTQEISLYKDKDNQIILEVGKKGKVSGFSTMDGVDTPISTIGVAEQEIALFAHDVGTGPGAWRDTSGFRYMSLTDMANELGLRTVVLVGYRLPFPDVYVGRTRGWKRETFEDWRRRHPDVGKGAHGEPPLPPTESQMRGRSGKRRKYEF